jgi:hypothetical protein
MSLVALLWPVPVDALTSLAHVADLERSVAFYERLGFRIGNHARLRAAGNV